jgi:hypothetical protein
MANDAARQMSLLLRYVDENHQPRKIVRFSQLMSRRSAVHSQGKSIYPLAQLPPPYILYYVGDIFCRIYRVDSLSKQSCQLLSISTFFVLHRHLSSDS